MNNFEKLYYTFCHRQAFRYVLDTFFADSPCYDELSYRADIHDLDKAVYLTIGDKKKASAYHRSTNSHHMENDLPKSEADLYEAIIDYECAGYTKDDKPLNAYDTIMQYNKPHGDEMILILEQYGMAYSYDNTPSDEGWREWQRANWVEPTESMIEDAIGWFCEMEPEWAEEAAEAAHDGR